MTGACGGSDDDARPLEPVESTTSTAPATELEPGNGLLTIGPDRLEFTVGTCSLDPAPGEETLGRRLFLLLGTGTVDGTPFDVEVTRYESSGGDVAFPTTTETIRITTTVDGELRGLEAERSGVSGDWLDVRDAEPSGALLEVEDGTVAAEGTFGPDASRAGSPEVAEGSLLATCPVR